MTLGWSFITCITVDSVSVCVLISVGIVSSEYCMLLALWNDSFICASIASVLSLIICSLSLSVCLRNKHLIACGSVLLMQDTSFQDFHAPLLKPWVHYVPFGWDGKDLPGKFHYLETHPRKAAEIAAASREFALRFFSEDAILAYIHEMVLQYRSLQDFPVVLDEQRTVDLTGVTSDDVDKYPMWYIQDTEWVGEWPGLGVDWKPPTELLNR